MSNNTSLIAIGLAAIMMIGALTGALIVVVSNDNNTSNVNYAPETPNALREYAKDLCGADSRRLSSDSTNEAILYESLLNDSFVVNGKTMKIRSVESFRTYLTSLGFYVYEDTDSDTNSYALMNYTLSRDDVNLLTGYFTSVAMSASHSNPFSIESMTARTFLNNDFARIAPEVNNIDDLVSLLSKTGKKTALYDYFGGFVFEMVRTEADGTVYSYTTPISNSTDFLEYLNGIDDRYDWFYANIKFMDPSNVVNDGSTCIVTTGQLLDFIKKADTVDFAYAESTCDTVAD